MDVREKLVELFAVTSLEFEEAVTLADHLISSGVTVQEWIPVGSLPKKPGEYLCYFKYEPESPNIICQNTYYGSGRWMSESDKVTHWACLPQPPKEKSHDE